jgi:hypothetical protein
MNDNVLYHSLRRMARKYFGTGENERFPLALGWRELSILRAADLHPKLRMHHPDSTQYGLIPIPAPKDFLTGASFH